ncbi:MAG: multiheme c-type cytochrome [Burkholderiales bacterium]|nr:multiheme c-type cytochrome [Burkholderiales bacterium]MDZ4355013.1 multiheme c-type cytochrome [Variovorax sp.]
MASQPARHTSPRVATSRHRWGALLLAAAMAGLGGCGKTEVTPTSTPAPTTAPAPLSAPSATPAMRAAAPASDTPAARAAIDAFLQSHWARPADGSGIRASGPGLEGAALDVAACAACHPAQFADWRHSLHSRAMGPGVAGQLVTMVAADPASGESCTRCHAPLAEQTRSLEKSVRSRPPATATTPSAGTPADRLHERGLMCASCHVRNGQVFGPPRRDGSTPGAGETASALHRWSASTAFESSRFCATCHQFEPDGFALNGKLLENTLNEWQASRYAREGVSCQSCHMPDRRHLWRGIHDPDMVRRALTIEVTRPTPADGGLAAHLRIRNTGAGHFFPTYVTPRVFVQAYQQDRDGRELPATRQQWTIARDVKLDLSAEIADTRIPPDGQAEFDYRAPRHAGAATLVLRLWVEPDAFYREFYESLLASGQAGAGQAQIEQAHRDASGSGFVAWTEKIVLPGATKP